MKRYLLFGCMDYEGSGGWDDFLLSVDSLDEAIDFLKNEMKKPNFVRCDGYQVVDLQKLEIYKRIEINYKGEFFIND